MHVEMSDCDARVLQMLQQRLHESPVAAVSESGRLSLVDHILDVDYAASTSTSPMPSTYTANAKVHVQPHVGSYLWLNSLSALMRARCSGVLDLRGRCYITGKEA